MNARVGVALHPQSAATAGGMTYRPQVGVDQRQRRLSHKPENEGSSPSPATPSSQEDAAGAPPTPAARFDYCPFLNKRRLACLSPVLPETGICLEHSKKAAVVVAGLFGAAA